MGLVGKNDGKVKSLVRISHGRHDMKQMMCAVGVAIASMAFSPLSNADADCPKTEYESGFNKKLPIVRGDELITSNSPLFPKGNVTCRIGLNYRKMSENESLRIETGALNNIKYRIYYQDGSGSIQGDRSSTLDTIKDLQLTNWSTGCKVDGMEDTHWCYITKKDLTVGVWKDGRNFVSIGHDHFPKSNMAIRIGQNKPISALAESGFTNVQVKEIIEALRNGDEALTRYQEWPYEKNKDLKIDLYGFKEAWEIINVVNNRPAK